MMTMKRKTVVWITMAVIMTTLLFGNAAYALTTHQVIHLRIRVVGTLSLNLEDGWLNETLRNPKAEAFSELKEHGIYVNKLQQRDSTVWLFTKTE